MAEVGASPTDQLLLERIGVRGGAFTAAKAAVATGLPMDVVEPRLLALAVASGARMRVSGAGEVSYGFPPHLRRLLLSRSWRLRLRASLHALWKLVFRLIRCGFGVVLVLLVLVVSVAVVVLGLALLIRLDDDAGDALGGLVGGTLELLARLVVAVVTDQLWWGSPGHYPSGEGQSSPKRVAFLESVYSILFGDGDPNQGLEQQRWKRIGGLLQRNGGVVIAEDLAPLLNLPAPPKDPQLATDCADQGMLPVLLHFDGRPEVTEQGQLVYRFPALQGQPVEGSAPEQPSPPLRERRIPFTHATQEQQFGYWVLTVSLLLLSVLLLQWSVTLSTVLTMLALVGLAYAGLLLVVPLLRSLWWRRRNAEIQTRNRLRRLWLDWTLTSAGLLQPKRRAASLWRDRQSVGERQIVYSTDRDCLEQEFDR